jgi:cytoskeletal protein RodZ
MGGQPPDGGSNRAALLLVGVGILVVVGVIATAVFLVTRIDFGSLTQSRTTTAAIGTSSTPAAIGTSLAPAASATSSDATSAASSNASSNASSSASSSAPGPPRAGLGQEVRDGKFAFVVTSIDYGSVVADPNNPSATTLAQGIFVFVKMTVTNVGNQPEPFVGVWQKLKSGTNTFNPSPNAQKLLGIMESINPGEQIEATIAYDVPNGTKPQSIELRDLPLTGGTEVFFG